MSNDYIVCCVARNEEPYLDEWITHYLKLGFDRIIINDNNDDPMQLMEFLKNKHYTDKVTVIPYNGAVSFQIDAYKTTYEREKFKWCAFFDIDEFLELAQHTSIQEYLSMFPDDAGSVYIHWLHYGTNGLRVYDPRPVVERFKYHTVPCFRKPTRNHHIKSIVKKPPINDITLIIRSVHDISIAGYKQYANNATQTNMINYDYAILKHYATKSLGEFVLRNMSGNRCPSETNRHIRNPGRFINSDSNNESIDGLIIRCMTIDGSRFDGYTRILVYSTDPQVILSTLKAGKDITLAGADKSGNLLCLYMDTASVNGVNKLSWRFDTQSIDESLFDIIVR